MNMNTFCYKCTKDVLKSKKPTFFNHLYCYYIFVFNKVLLPTSSLRLDWKHQKTLGLQPETWGAGDWFIADSNGIHPPKTNSKFAPENRPKRSKRKQRI